MQEKTWYSEKWVGRQATFSPSRYVNKIAKKRYDHCMAYTAPDATKTKTLGRGDKI